MGRRNKNKKGTSEGPERDQGGSRKGPGTKGRGGKGCPQVLAPGKAAPRANKRFKHALV